MSESTAERAAEDVDVVGPPDGTPVVLVHGTIFNRTMWAPQRESLAEEFRVIAPDLPGHGARRDESFELEAGIDAVADAVDRHADEPVALVGLSLGGYVATAYAARNPDAVDRLVVTGSSANPVGLLGTLSGVVGRAAKLAARSERVEGAVDRVAAWWVRKRDLDADVEREIVEAGFDLRPFGEGGVEIANVDFRGAFAAFDGPALVANGQWDLLMRSGAEDHAHAAPNASVRVIRGAGHTCNLEQVETFERALRDFLAARD